VEQDRYTLAYRATEARQVMGWIKAGQSGSLIGLRGAGKSNFLRFLLHEDVRQHYLGQAYTDFLFVLSDLLLLAECTEWAVYALILERLRQFCLWSVDQQAAEEMALPPKKIARIRDPLIAQRAVERCVNILCEPPTRHLVLLFDEFDAVFRELDPSLFRCLRAIRDDHKEQISYVIVVNDLTCLRCDAPEMEHFCRLVSRNVCGLGPYSAVDARQMVYHLASQRSVELSERDVVCLLELSGGHAGLLKTILSLLWGTYQGASLEQLTPCLKDEPAVQSECRKVWGSLSEDEQAALCALADGAQIDPPMLRRLKLRGLVRGDQSEASLFSPLFADFACQQTPPLMKTTVVTRSPRIVQIAGRRIEGLTELEFELLFYLYQHQGEVCTKDDLIENVYRQRYDRMAGGVSDEALQALVSRLRAKVEPPRYITTARGEGYRFVEPEER
jgi:DNA-binding winged helix-turn-helix (wHTH) protein